MEKEADMEQEENVVTDYDVEVQVVIHSGFDGREFNDLMYETVKGQLVENVMAVTLEKSVITKR